MRIIRKILLSIILIILVTNLTSCSPKEKIVYKTKVVYKQCPKINVPQKPQPNSYQSVKLKWKEDYYYCLTTPNAKILVTNWLEYKSWCESLYKSIKEFNETNK